jgi:signal transduction histidine kinase
MIRQLWLRLIGLVLAFIVPLSALSFWQVRETIQLVWQMNPPEALLPFVEQSMKDQLDLNATKTSEENNYRDRFEQLLQLRTELQALKNLSDEILASVEWQTARNGLIAVVAGLFLSYFISRSVLKDFRTLQKKELEAERLRSEMTRLQDWQSVARAVVHELRSPMVPLTVLSDSLEKKYKALPPEKFQLFLSESTKLLKEQSAGMQRLIESFTTFAKLPDAKLKTFDFVYFVGEFLQTHQAFAGDRASFSFESCEPSVKINGDGILLQALLFNLLRNALEANQNTKIRFCIGVSVSNGCLFCKVSNSGSPVPPALVERLFYPKMSSGSGNKLGLGLSICRKIALDHQGDIELTTNSREDGVEWTLRIPVCEGVLS